MIIKTIAMVIVIVLATLIVSSVALFLWIATGGDDGRVERQLEEERSHGKRD